MGPCRTATPVLLTLLAFAGCGGSDGTGPNDDGRSVASVVVAPDANTFTTLIETLRFTASAHDASGDPIPGKAFVWSSSIDSVVTVSASGLVSPVSNGSATITATSEGTSGTAEVIVEAVAAAMRFYTLSVGASHACGITAVGQPYCWGQNDTGRLGDSTVTGRREPAQVVGGRRYRSVSAGGDHTCGVTTRGAVYCWGDDTTGQLGNGNDTEPVPCPFPCSIVPVWVSGGLTFQSVSAGGGHTCGITIPGRAFCWGENSNGQLGTETDLEPDECVFACSTTPVGVLGAGLTFQSVSAGFTHSCGATTAGQAYCWGENTFGQLGDGTTTGSLEPVTVAGGLAVQSVHLGDGHSCALTTTGLAYCWGDDAHGQLGDGTNTRRLEPVLVVGGFTFQSVWGGGAHTCALTIADQPHCWGWNNFGQLGDGTTTERHEPAPVTGGLTFRSVYAGGAHSCGLTTEGQPYCWGRNSRGQLGDGTGTQSSVPVAVAGPL